MATMTKTQRIKFWWRQGFDLIESIHMASRPVEMDVIVALKRLRIENEKRKRAQQSTA